MAFRPDPSDPSPVQDISSFVSYNARVHLGIEPLSGHLQNVSASREGPAQWTPDGKSLLISGAEIPTRVFVMDLATGKRNLFGTYAPADPTGLAPLGAPNYSRDRKSYVYNYSRITSDLYIVDGLK